MLLLWSAAILLFLAYILKSVVLRLTQRLPPGPWGLPVLGYAPFISTASSRDYLKMEKKYGRIFGFYYGSRYMVVLNDFKEIKEAFNKDEFTDRPPFLKIDDKKNHLGNMNGGEWKETRRFTLSTLRNLGMGKNKVEEAITEEILLMFKKLEGSTEVNVYNLVYPPLLKVAFKLVCGSCSEDDEVVIERMERYHHALFEKLAESHRELYYPYFHSVLSAIGVFSSKSKPWLKEMDDYMWNEIKLHEKNSDENIQDDFLDYYIKEIQKNSTKTTSFTRLNMNANGQTLLFVGSDTTRVALVWTYLCLAKYPEMQEKVYKEIVEFCGKERMPAWSEKGSLPYTNAFIMEVARLKTIAPAADPHLSNDSGTIGGFDIPNNTIILANLYAVHMDPRLWGDPEEFRPERFLSADGKTATAPEYWVPFLTGKRSCPGEKLAMMQLFLFVTSVVQKFKLSAPSGGLSLEENENFLLLAVNPNVSFQRRE